MYGTIARIALRRLAVSGTRAISAYLPLNTSTRMLPDSAASPGLCSLICSRGGIAEQPGRGHHSSGATATDDDRRVSLAGV